jgi:hypothetical protein
MRLPSTARHYPQASVDRTGVEPSHARLHYPQASVDRTGVEPSHARLHYPQASVERTGVEPSHARLHVALLHVALAPGWRFTRSQTMTPEARAARQDL